MGFVFQAAGDLFGANAQANEAGYQAQVAQNNATIARNNAAYATNAGEESAMEKSLEGAALGGRIKASQGANNVDVNSGSAVRVQQSQREASKLDTLTTENNALLEAYGYKSQATNLDAQAGLYKQEGQYAWAKGVESIVSDASNDASQALGLLGG